MNNDYSISELVDNSSKNDRLSVNYLGTTEDIQDVRLIQEYVRNTNKMNRRVGMPTFSVKIGTRLGRNNPRSDEVLPGSWVPMDIAERFDVYLKANW